MHDLPPSEPVATAPTEMSPLVDTTAVAPNKSFRIESVKGMP